MPAFRSSFTSLSLLLGGLLLMGVLPTSAQAQHPTSVTSIVNSAQDTTLETNHNGSLLAPGTYDPTTPNDSIPATGAGTRLMWYPAKAAFRAGRVFDIDPALSPNYKVFWNSQNVGEYSTALGVNTKASGFASTAAGSRTRATGDYSVAIGGPGRIDTEATIASGAAAIAMGSFATASGDYSVAMNRETRATALAATAMGEGTEASVPWATAMGHGTTAATRSSLTIGTFNDKNRGNDDSDPGTGPLFVVGNGLPGSPSDALVLDQSGNLTISGTLTESSDRRLKTSIRPLKDETLAKLSQLRPVRYQFKNQQTHPSGEQIGLVAQDVRTEFPALVSGENGDALSLSYSKFTAVLLKGLQEQQADLEAKEDEIATLKAENEEIKDRLAALEAKQSSALAGLAGPGALALLLVGLGGTLLWRRRQ